MSILIWLIILLIICCSILGYTTINLLTKNEKLENITDTQNEFIISLNEKIQSSSVLLNEIDQKGSFEADDEIGWFFKNIKEIQTMLNQFTLQNGETQKEKK